MKHPLTPLDIKRKDLGNALANRYRVYKTPEDFIVVEAATAAEAFKTCGVDAPYKIVRETVNVYATLPEDVFKKAEAAPVMAAEASAGAEGAAPAAPAAPEKLSSDDVNKLLGE